MNDVPEEDLNDLTREAYAHFGLAYFLAECVFEGLVQVAATKGVGLAVGAIEERTKRLRGGTLGPLVSEAKEVIPVERHADLDRLLERRNDLAHGFWFARAYQLTSANGLEALIATLTEDQKLFRGLSALTDELTMPHLISLGMTEESWEQSMRAAREGPPEAELDRPLLKAGAQIRILGAWHVPPTGLVFRDDQGHHWEPCDLGLGWCVGSVESHWKPVFTELLPASVVARPRGVKPWDYTVEFSSGLQMRGFIDPTSKVPTVRILRPPRARRVRSGE
ncbi:MAG: hypothetical protein Q8L48_01525 [Archangium sp.]|nr:hypothetical protein [Archangium sp.]